MLLWILNLDFAASAKAEEPFSPALKRRRLMLNNVGKGMG